MVVHFPYRSGMSRQGAPVCSTHKMPFRIRRWFCTGRPRRVFLFGSRLFNRSRRSFVYCLGLLWRQVYSILHPDPRKMCVLAFPVRGSAHPSKCLTRLAVAWSSIRYEPPFRSQQFSHISNAIALAGFFVTLFLILLMITFIESPAKR